MNLDRKIIFIWFVLYFSLIYLVKIMIRNIVLLVLVRNML